MEKSEICLSYTIIQKLGIFPLPEQITVCAGQKKVTANVKILPQLPQGYTLSPTLKQLLGLHSKKN